MPSRTREQETTSSLSTCGGMFVKTLVPMLCVGTHTFSGQLKLVCIPSWERGNVGTWERGNEGTRERGGAPDIKIFRNTMLRSHIYHLV
jgi:hypothetical protein